jgi:hypothetical protein
MGWGKDVEKYKSGVLYFFHTAVANDPGSDRIGILLPDPDPIYLHNNLYNFSKFILDSGLLFASFLLD